jgi:hypothetical protein
MSEEPKKSNLAKGRVSYDSDSTGMLIPFFNRNVSEYATEAGGVKFDLVPVTKQKDIMLNVGRLHAQQEYNRIMELVAVLQKQAASIKRRLEITDMVHQAKYEFQVGHGQIYWLAYDTRNKCSILTHHGPTEWCTGKPENYDYIARVKYMGDYSWQEIDKKGNYVNQ